MKKIVILTVCLLAFVGCGGKPVEAEKLSGHWVLAEGTKDEAEITSAKLFLNVEFNTDEEATDNPGKFLSVNGLSGVNTFFGNMELDGNKILQPLQIGSTRMSGDPAVMDVEMKFMEAFSSVNTIATPDENTIVFEGPDTELKYTRFDLTKLRLNLKRYYDEDASFFVDVTAAEVPYLIFNADGTVGGSTGINSVSLGYKLGESDFVFDYPLTFSEGAMTLAASGDEDATDTETAFLNAIMHTSYIRLENNGVISFMDEEKVPMLIFETLYEQ